MAQSKSADDVLEPFKQMIFVGVTQHCSNPERRVPKIIPICGWLRLPEDPYTLRVTATTYFPQSSLLFDYHHVEQKTI